MKVKITPIHLEKMKALRSKTGVGSNELLKHAEDVPEGLTPKRIDNWLKRLIRSANQDHIDFVIEEWGKARKRSDSTEPCEWKRPLTHNRRLEDDLIPIEATMLKELQKYKSLNWLPGFILKERNDVPHKLTQSMVSQWLSGSVKRANPEHLDYVLTRCKDLSDLATK